MPVSSILWSRDDLRLTDHPALDAAARCSSVAPVFVLDDVFSAVGGAAKWWLHHALASLSHDIAAAGGKWCLSHGDAATVLADLARVFAAKR